MKNKVFGESPRVGLTNLVEYANIITVSFDANLRPDLSKTQAEQKGEVQ